MATSPPRPARRGPGPGDEALLNMVFDGESSLVDETRHFRAQMTGAPEPYDEIDPSASPRVENLERRTGEEDTRDERVGIDHQSHLLRTLLTASLMSDFRMQSPP